MTGIGTSLLHYRLAEKIGEGGMGVVWRASDSTLGRDVAIKILPPEFAADPERLARFDREAKLLASLNHPNIAAIYGFHEAGGVRFLAMELVPGEGLDERISRGAIPMDEARAIAREIAGALEYAHERAIVHRDLKPANIKITPDGTVKLLDFGLAKAVGGDAAVTNPASTPTILPTVTSAGTAVGMILGTAAYMSPEQARGKAVDKRADIWAFGVVLFEMLTGRRLFEGETVSDTIAALLTRAIDLDALPTSAPAPLRRLLARCLERDPKTRLRDIGEARIALSALERTHEAQEPAPTRKRSWLLPVAGMLLGGLLGLLVGTQLKTAEGAVAAVKPATLRRLTDLPGPERHPHLSPDGRQLIYASAAGGNLDVYLLRVGGDRAVNLTAGSEFDDSQGKISPDGESIAFRSERDGGGMFTMGATGESVRRVTDFGMDPCWSPDGRKLAFATEAVDDPYSRMSLSTLWTVELATGQKQQLTTSGDAVQPAWSPDGRHIAYWANTGGQRDLWIIGADGGDPLAVTNDHFTDWSPVWSPDGRWLYFSSDRGGSMNVWRLPVDASGVPRGDAQPVTTGTQSMGWAGFSGDGRRLVAMAYNRTCELSLHELARLRRGETAPLRRLKLQSSTQCTVSPDAEWISCSTRGTPEDLVLLRSDGSEMRRLTDDVHKDRGVSWTPDGKALAFYSTRSGAWNYWGIRSDGSDLRQITAVSDFNGGVISPDGTQLALNADYKGLVLVDVNVAKPVDRSSMKPLPMPEGYAEAMFAPSAWSPDGRFIAGFETDSSGRAASYAIYDLTQKSLRRLDLATEGRAAIAGWLPDSRRLVLRGAAGVAIYDTVAGTTQTILAESDFIGLGLARQGEALMIESERIDSEIWLLEFE